MAVNSIDYANTLSEKTKEFREDMDDLRSNQKKTLDQVETQNDNKVSSLKEAYRKDLGNKEEAYSTYIDSVKSDNEEDLLKAKKGFVENLKGTREEFSSSRSEDLKEYRGKLDELRRSFNNAVKNENQVNTRLRDNQEKSFNNSVDAQKKNFESSINEFSRDASENAESSRKRNQLEKRKLVLNLNSKLDDQTTESSSEMRRLKEKFGNEFNRVRTTTGTLNEDKNRQFEKRLQIVTDRNSTEKQNLIDNFKASTKRSNRANELEEAKGIREFNREIRDIQSSQAQDLNFKNRQIEELKERDSESSGSAASRKLTSIQNRFQDRVDAAKIELDNYKGQVSDENDVKSLTQQDTLKKKDLRTSLLMKKRDQEVNKLITDYTDRSRENSAKLVDSYKRELQNIDRFHNTRYNERDLQNKKRYENALEHHSKNIIHMDDMNKKTFEAAKKEFETEKNFIVKNSSELRMEEAKELRKSHKLDIAKREEKFSLSKQDTQEQVNRNKQKLNFKIEKLNDLRQADLTFVENQAREREKQNNELFKNELERQHLEHGREIREIKNNADRKLSKMRFEYETKLSKIKEDHQKKERMVLLENSTEMNRKDMESRTLYQRLKTQNEVQLQALQEQFEEKLEQLKLDKEIALDKARRSV